MAFAHPVVVGNLADLKAGFTPVRVLQPLLVGQGDIVTKHLLVGFINLLRRLRRVNVVWLQVDQLLLAFTGQQLHRPVAARELFIFVAVENQIRRGVEERAQERGLLLQLDLRLLALFHLHFQLLKGGLALSLGDSAIVEHLIERGDIIFKLNVELEIALAHLFELLYQPG